MVSSSVGPYEVLEKIGTGGMSEVFLANDSRLKRRVALKRLLLSDPQEGDRIRHEARALAQLNHSNIAAVYDVLPHEGRHFIVMEYAAGPSLRERLMQGRLPLVDVITIGRQLASALAAAHGKGVIHRDLKPANIHVTDSGVVKVVDFGIAVRNPESLSEESTTTNVPILNSRCAGTPAYMSPEQRRGEPATAKSDIYSLGVVLFEMATGRRPFELEQVVAISRARDASTTSIDPSVPVGLCDVIAKALERDPAKRFASAQEIERALTDLGTNGTERSTISHRAGIGWGVVATAATVVTIAASGAWRPFVHDVFGHATGTPEVLAVLPVANPSGEPLAEQYGVALATLAARNLRVESGLKIVSGEATSRYAMARTDLEPLRRDVGASYALDLTVRSVTPSVDLLARLRRPGAVAPAWEQSITGNAVEVENLLLHQLVDALGRQGIRPRSDVEGAALVRLPTPRADALMSYVQARTLLDYKEVAGNAKRAADLLEQATSTDGRFALSYAGLADAFRTRAAAERDSTLLDRAMSAAKRALELDPEESAAHTAFAALEYASGRRDAAVTSVRRAIDLQADNDEAHRLFGQILASQGRVDEGVAELNAAIQLRPTSFNHYFTLGFILFTNSRYAAAVDAYQKAAEIRPSHAGPYENLGAIYQMLGDTHRAIGNYEHAIRLGPSATADANLAVAYFTAGEYEKARSALDVAIGRDPRKASLYRYLGDVYRKMNRRDDARAAYERAIALSNAELSVKAEDPFPIVLIALCEAGLGHRLRAERHAAEAMALAPANRDVLFRSAKVFALTGNNSAAFDALKRAVEGGYDREVARHDPELAPLRSLPEFERALSAAPSTSR